jgi:hypothetical protein
MMGSLHDILVTHILNDDLRSVRQNQTIFEARNFQYVSGRYGSGTLVNFCILRRVLRFSGPASGKIDLLKRPVVVE